MTSQAMTKIPDDDPIMVVWLSYQESEEYLNSFRWAEHEQHRKGSLWAAFLAGWKAGQEAIAQPPHAPTEGQETGDVGLHEPTLTDVTLRESDDTIDLECRFSDGQKFAAIQVDTDFPDLANIVHDAHRPPEEGAGRMRRMRRRLRRWARDSWRRVRLEWYRRQAHYWLGLGEVPRFWVAEVRVMALSTEGLGDAFRDLGEAAMDAAPAFVKLFESLEETHP